MKKLKLVLLTVGIFCTSLLFHSCLDDDGYSLGKFWVAVATVESLDDYSHYFRLDDGTTLWPANVGYTGHNLETGRRAWLNYTILSDEMSGFDHYIKVNGVDPILTKKIAENMGEENDSIYGTAPVALHNEDIWIGDGYLNLIFKFNYGGQERHFVNLIPRGNDETGTNGVYELEFRHHAYDDPPINSVGGIVCFDISELSPGDDGMVKLKVYANTFNGERTYEFEYNSQKDSISERAPSDFAVDYFERVN